MPYHLATPACEQDFTTIEKNILATDYTDFHGKEQKISVHLCNPWLKITLYRTDTSNLYLPY